MKVKLLKDFFFEIYNEDKIIFPSSYICLGQNLNEHSQTLFFLEKHLPWKCHVIQGKVFLVYVWVVDELWQNQWPCNFVGGPTRKFW